MLAVTGARRYRVDLCVIELDRIVRRVQQPRFSPHTQSVSRRAVLEATPTAPGWRNSSVALPVSVYFLGSVVIAHNCL